MRAVSALATPGSSNAAPGLSMVRNSRRDTRLAIGDPFTARNSSPVLFTAREMDHYSQGGGDPNIVLRHGGHRRHAHVRSRSRVSGIGCGGERRMAKIPMTFACGL